MIGATPKRWRRPVGPCAVAGGAKFHIPAFVSKALYSVAVGVAAEVPEGIKVIPELRLLPSLSTKDCCEPFAFTMLGSEPKKGLLLE